MKTLLENWKRYINEEEETTALTVVGDTDFYKKAGRGLVIKELCLGYSRPPSEGGSYFRGKKAIRKNIDHANQILKAGSIKKLNYDYGGIIELPIDANHEALLNEIISYINDIDYLIDIDVDAKVPILLPQYLNKWSPAITKIPHYSYSGEYMTPKNELAEEMVGFAFHNLFGIVNKNKKNYNPEFEKQQYQELFKRVDESADEINVTALGFKINPSNITIEPF